MDAPSAGGADRDTVARWWTHSSALCSGSAAPSEGGQLRLVSSAESVAVALSRACNGGGGCNISFTPKSLTDGRTDGRGGAGKGSARSGSISPSVRPSTAPPSAPPTISRNEEGKKE